jgi:ferredoxin
MADKCMGCGACVLGCQQNALIFELVRPVEHIPLEPPSIPIILLPGISGRSIINNLK